MGIIRCRFVFSGKNDELTPDFPDTGFSQEAKPSPERGSQMGR